MQKVKETDAEALKVFKAKLSTYQWTFTGKSIDIAIAIAWLDAEIMKVKGYLRHCVGPNEVGVWEVKLDRSLDGFVEDQWDGETNLTVRIKAYHGLSRERRKN
jgi:hypothetical protein